MAIKKEFMDAVQTGRLLRVRIMLKDSLLLDPSGESFREMESYALQNMEGLYLPDDGEPLNEDISTWTKEGLDRELVTLVNSFTRERVALVKRMVALLYRDEIAHRKISDDPRPQPQPAASKHGLGMGVAVAGAAVAVAGVCTSHTLLVVGGIVVAGAGVTVLLTDKGA